MASMCLARLENGEPNTQVVSRKRRANSEFKDLEGNPLTEGQMIDLTGLTAGTLRDLYTRYNGDCSKILANHGKTRTTSALQTKYRDRLGVQMDSKQLGKKYGINPDRVCFAFNKCKFNYVKAFELLEKLEGREL